MIWERTDATVRTLSAAAVASVRAERSLKPAMMFTMNNTDKKTRIRPKPM